MMSPQERKPAKTSETDALTSDNSETGQSARDTQHSSDMVGRVGELDQFLTQPEASQAMYDAAKAALGRDGPWRVVWSAMIEASDIPARHSELVEALQRISDHETSAPCRTAEEANERCIDEMKRIALDALANTNGGGQRPTWAKVDLQIAEFRVALASITQHYPPDTIAGQLAADVLAKHPNPFAKIGGER